MNSLEVISTPGDSLPTKKTSNPRDNNQEWKLLFVQNGNLVTKTAASVKECTQSKDSSQDSDNSNLL